MKQEAPTVAVGAGEQAVKRNEEAQKLLFFFLE